MKRVLAVLVLVVSTLPAEVLSIQSSSWLSPGEYRLRITATEGPKKGSSADGSVSLRPTRADDRSPLGLTAQDRNIGSHPLFGWTDTPFADVGAPMSSGGPETKATSTDPVYPGILVDMGWKPKEPEGRPSDAPILWVASVVNRRDGSHWTDGSGIVLFVMKRDASCLTGNWREAGLELQGRGTFTLCPK